MRKIIAYTDGGCNPNPGPGGWGSVIIEGDKVIDRILGGEKETTNNRMEITAVIETLECFKEPADIIICTDSQYVCKSISQWIYKWQRKGFYKVNNGSLKNPDLWEKVWKLIHHHKVTIYWIPAHKDIGHNEEADDLATKGRIKAVGATRVKDLSYNSQSFVENRYYPYSKITAAFHEIADEEQYGNFMIGEHFLVFRFKDNGESIVSFVLTGVIRDSGIYKLIYMDQ